MKRIRLTFWPHDDADTERIRVAFLRFAWGADLPPGDFSVSVGSEGGAE